MFKPWKFILFFLLCLVLSLLLNLPVAQVLPYAKLPPTVQLYGINGTLLNGSAQQLMVNQFPLREVSYRFLPSCLLKLKLCYRIKYDQGRLQLAYDLLNADAEINRARIDYSVAQLLTLSPAPLIVIPSGSVELEIDELSLLDKQLALVSGRVIWRNLGVDQGEVQIDIGDYQVDFTGNNEQFDFTLSDLDADFEASGGGSLTADGQYEMDLRLDARSSIDPNIRKVLDLVGERAAVNKYRIEQSGRLPPRIARQLFR